MTMNAKRYLTQYSDLAEKIKLYEERLEDIATTPGIKGIELDGMPRSTKLSKPTEKATLELIEAKERLENGLIRAKAIKQRILDKIELVPVPIYRELLISRYIRLMTWEAVTDQVSELRTKRSKSGKNKDERYTVSHVMGPMHGRALKSFEKVLEKYPDNIE